MKNLYLRIPVRVRREAGHVAVTFAAAFAAVAAPALPAILHSPDFGTARALTVATLAGALAAGVRAAKPAVEAAAGRLFGKRA